MVDLSSLRHNELSEHAWASYQDYLEALDRYDLDRFATFLADDVTVQFGNDAPLAGKETAVEGMAAFWQSISDLGFVLTHEPLNVYGTDDRYVLEALNHYDRDGRDRITIRAVAFTDRDDTGQVTSIRVYQDLSPLFDGPTT